MQWVAAAQHNLEGGGSVTNVLKVEGFGQAKALKLLSEFELNCSHGVKSKYSKKKTAISNIGSRKDVGRTKWQVEQVETTFFPSSFNTMELTSANKILVTN